MFTGLIETVGSITLVKPSSKAIMLGVSIGEIAREIKLGDSIATNGVCLTVAEKKDDGFIATVMPATMENTNLGKLTQGSKVNIERAMQLSDRLDGHMVTGHVDAVGEIVSIRQVDQASLFRFRVKQDILSRMIDRGSVAIDGISLTIQRLYEDGFEVSIIPHTSKETILSYKKSGDFVNIETDVIGKYVERLLGLQSKKETIDMNFLAKCGYI